MSKKKIKFEQALVELEEAVEKLNSDELSLDESIQVFEQGMDLAIFCEKKLSEAQGKVETIIKSFEKAKKELGHDEAI